ncbi:MAG: FmdB family transcriptional regulator [Opitutae bacterium]|nr:FmdB family transcriptional regulator [Opitutae bacterium]
MPTYEYVCPPCGHEFERFQSMKDEPVKVCPKCRKRQVKRKIGMGAGLIFKGSGFYETDYKQAGRKKEKKSDGKSDSKSENKSKGSDKKKPASDSGKSATKKASS